MVETAISRDIYFTSLGNPTETKQRMLEALWAQKSQEARMLVIKARQNPSVGEEIIGLVKAAEFRMGGRLTHKSVESFKDPVLSLFEESLPQKPPDYITLASNKTNLAKKSTTRTRDSSNFFPLPDQITRIILYFHLDGSSNSLKEIGELYGISDSAVWQSIQKGLKTIKKNSRLQEIVYKEASRHFNL